MTVDLVLCPVEDGYSALAQLAGESGWTKRVLVGRPSHGGVIQLVDQAIVDGKLAKGWRSCQDTTYTIALGSPADASAHATYLGSYESRECDDEALLRFSVHTRTSPGRPAPAPLTSGPTPAEERPTRAPSPSVGAGLDVDPFTETPKDRP